jgi:hypothetical protein
MKEQSNDGCLGSEHSSYYHDGGIRPGRCSAPSCLICHVPADASHTDHHSTLLKTQRTSARDLLLAVDLVWRLS